MIAHDLGLHACTLPEFTKSYSFALIFVSPENDEWTTRRRSFERFDQVAKSGHSLTIVVNNRPEALLFLKPEDRDGRCIPPAVLRVVVLSNRR